MIHNDVLRRLRYALAINDTAAISIFKLANYDMEIDYLHAVMKREGEEGYSPCRDKIIGLFLDGLIIKNRGRQEGQGPKVLGPKERLSNNEVMRKIRIAMSYKDEDMIHALQLADFRISKSELSAFFRKPDHRNFKPAGDQVVRNLLQGMVKKHRPDSTVSHRNTKSDDRKPSSGKPNEIKPAKKKGTTHSLKTEKGELNSRHTNAVRESSKQANTSVWGTLPSKKR